MVKKSIFCKLLYHRKCKQRGVGGQKKTNLVNVVCERPPMAAINPPERKLAKRTSVECLTWLQALAKLVKTFRISIESSHEIPQGFLQFKLFLLLSIDLIQKHLLRFP